MKKILLITILFLLMSFNSQAKIGKGDLTFTPEILEYFIKYLRHAGSTSFVVSKDGKFALYGICGGVCSGGPGHTGTMMKNCKKVYGQKCFIFAQRKKFSKNDQILSKKIRWNKLDYEFLPGFKYGIVDSNGKTKYTDDIAEGCNSKFDCWGISKEYLNKDINKILTELGFLKKDTPKTRIVLDDNPSDSVTKKIQNLFDLYKSGALSEDDFKIAKKMLLFSE